MIELLITISIIGILAAIALPNLSGNKERAQASAIASEVKMLGKAFEAYYQSYGEYPADSHDTLPAGMDEFWSDSRWPMATPWEGFYNWDGPNNYPYAGIAIYDTYGDVENMQDIDAILDDGNLLTGIFRQTPNGRYTYILAE